MKWTDGWSRGIKAKLLLAASIPVIAIGIISYVSLSRLNTLGTRLEQAYEVTAPTFEALGSVLAYRNGMNYYFWQAIAYHDRPEKRTKVIEKAEDSFKRMKDSLTFYESTKFTEEETKNWQAYRKNQDQFFRLSEEIISKLKTSQDDPWVQAQLDGGEWHVLVTDLRVAVQANTTLYEEISKHENQDQKNLRAEARKIVISLGLMALLLTFGGILYIAHKVASTVGNVVLTLTSSSHQLNDALAQMSEAGQSLANSSTSSAASLEETVASLEELTSMVNLNSDNARTAAGLSSTSREVAAQGEQEIRKLLEAMSGISSSSKKIEEITNVIDDIAFQTNLLALNASVEAARAGEHGKGFAVVADAVRTLAQRAGTAAKDITSLIRESAEQVQQGSRIASESSEVLTKIVDSVKKVSDINEEIAAASTEQASGIKQISVAMNNLDQSTQNNAASSEEIAATSTEISSQAAAMKDAAFELETIVLGRAS